MLSRSRCNAFGLACGSVDNICIIVWHPNHLLFVIAIDVSVSLPVVAAPFNRAAYLPTLQLKDARREDMLHPQPIAIWFNLRCITRSHDQGQLMRLHAIYGHNRRRGNAGRFPKDIVVLVRQRKSEILDKDREHDFHFKL